MQTHIHKHTDNTEKKIRHGFEKEQEGYMGGFREMKG